MKTENEREAQQAELLQETMERAQNHADAADDAADATQNTETMEDLLAWNRHLLDGATALSTLLIQFSKDYRKERQHIRVHEAAIRGLLQEQDETEGGDYAVNSGEYRTEGRKRGVAQALHSRESAAIPDDAGLPAEAYLTPEYIGDFEKVRKVPVIVEAATIKKEITIITREGTLKGYPDDKLMRGIEGELYPCAIHIFNATYEYVIDELSEADDDGNRTGA